MPIEDHGYTSAADMFPMGTTLAAGSLDSTTKSRRLDTSVPASSGIHEERFRLLVEAVEDYAIYMLDPQGHVTTWNLGAERNKGYKSNEIIGQHFSRFFLPEDVRAGLPTHSLAEAARTGHYAAEGWRVRKDGTLFWASVVINAMRDPDGDLIGFAKVTRDLTERKATEERFRLLVEAVEDYAIYMLDPHGQVTTWNTGAERNKGYKSDEIIGQHFSRFFLPADIAAGAPEHSLAEAARTGHYAAEGWRVRKDGTLFWASVVINTMRDNRGDLIGFAKVTRDLTERKASEESLRRSEHALELEKDRLQVIIHAIGDAVISTDQAGHITMMNPAAETIVGSPFARVAQRPVEEVFRLVDAETRTMQIDPVRVCLASQKNFQQQEGVALLLDNGTTRDVHLFAAPIQIAGGAVTGAVLTLQDVTNMRVIQREIEFNALHDALTRLPNRRKLEQRIQEALQQATSGDSGPILCILDLDRFKIVNDTAGHIAGDALLRTISSLLLRHVDHSDMVARLGGDEFAIVLEQCSLEKARSLLTELIKKIADLEFFWEEHVFQISTSIGAAAIVEGLDLLGLVKCADAACYKAKHGGRNRLEFYNPAEEDATPR